MESVRAVACIFAAALAPAAARAGDIDPTELVRRYNGRDIGQSGWRRVTLEMRSGREVTRSFQVVNLWQRDESSLRTLFLLEKPPGIHGTAYLLTENIDPLSDMKVWLHLPAGKRGVLELDARSFDEGLLGSDFTYRDMRWRLPERGWSLRYLGRADMGGRSTRVIDMTAEAGWDRGAVGWDRMRVYLADEPLVILGMDFFNDTAARRDRQAPVRQMRVEAFDRLDGVWSPTKMVMTLSDRQSCALILGDLRVNRLKLNPAEFVKHALPAWAARVRKGWTPERPISGAAD